MIENTAGFYKKFLQQINKAGGEPVRVTLELNYRKKRRDCKVFEIPVLLFRR